MIYIKRNEHEHGFSRVDFNTIYYRQKMYHRQRTLIFLRFACVTKSIRREKCVCCAFRLPYERRIIRLVMRVLCAIVTIRMIMNYDHINYAEYFRPNGRVRRRTKLDFMR